MLRMLREEVNRALRNQRVWLALLLTTGFLALGVFKAYEKDWVPAGFSYADLWYFAYSGSYFLYVLPLVGALPFADSLVVDQTEGFLRYLVIRSKYHNYLVAKLVANALVGALVVLLPLIGLYLAVNIIAPRGSYPINVWQPGISGRPTGVLVPLFRAQPDVFVLLIALLASGLSALYSNLGLAVSMALPNRYLAWGAPCAIYLLADFVAHRTHFFGPGWSPIVAAAGSVSVINESLQWFFLNPLGILATTLILIVIFGQRKRILR